MKITMDLPDDQAMALAQLTKRMGYTMPSGCRTASTRVQSAMPC
jgi:hypothetical protein